MALHLQRLHSSLEPPSRTVRRILLCPLRAALLVRTRGLDARRPASPLARRLTEPSPPCAPYFVLPSHSLALHARDMPLFCHLSDPLGCLPRTACSSRCCMCSWRLIQHPLPLRNCPRGAVEKSALVNSWARRSAIDAPTPPESSVSRMNMCATCFTVPFAGGAMQSPDEQSAKANLISALGDEWTTSH